MICMMTDLFMKDGTGGQNIQHQNKQNADNRRKAMKPVMPVLEKAVHMLCFTPQRYSLAKLSIRGREVVRAY